MYPRREGDMDREIAILMADLTGYTAMTDAHGGASAARIVKKYMEIVNAACAGTARVSQRVGDQVVIIAEHAVDLVDTVNKISAQTLEEHHFLSIHAGMHFGSVFFENESLFGSTINIASRIMNIARRGQILCSAAFVSHLASPQREQFISIGPHRLKNVPDNLELFELIADTRNGLLYVDPVCHMHLSPENAIGRYDYNEVTYHFCSDHCLKMFQASPSRFLDAHT